MSFLPLPETLTPAPPARGHVALVGAGPGAADLLTLRALDRIRRADVVLFDRLVEPEVLALIPDRAARLFVGKEVGACAWPQERIDAAIVAFALAGQRVVRLKSGDPSIFGRAAEEIAAVRAHGIEVEIVPGITAASALAASTTRPLTERGQTDRLVLATATCRPGEPWQDCDLRPGTTLALYMAMHRLAAVAADMAAAGLGPDTGIEIVSRISTPAERRLETTLGRLLADVEASGIGNPAIVLVRVPKTAAACPQPGLMAAG
ncbi:uroporphyrinogen-III C-methyltransferase [Frigidibacter oleivorans]|uniref:uroporphyrinogen-III C-methyltransferase n=1 Tax=Frigidibacter oleivorans TaxID=2487129 RepID=UPI000F8F163C|nr:uroporphyrinogen-III C-methyltransferase [Frigidibacter oleivorans]